MSPSSLRIATRGSPLALARLWTRAGQQMRALVADSDPAEGLRALAQTPLALETGAGAQAYDASFADFIDFQTVAGLEHMLQTQGQTLRLPIPDLTEERRKELAKLAAQYAEKAKIAIRNVRRDGMEALKEDEKKKVISEDERKRFEDEVQKLTDKYVKDIDALIDSKSKEIMTV